MVRLFKRFYYATIEQKYGYLKANAQEKVEISGKLFITELELNPKVLRLCGLFTTFSADCFLNWLQFLKVMSLFLLCKEVRKMRFEFIVRWLSLKSAAQITQWDYIQEQMQAFQFTKRNCKAAEPEIFAFWDLIRFELHPHSDELFPDGEGRAMKFDVAEQVLMESHIEARQTLEFFNLIFELS